MTGDITYDEWDVDVPTYGGLYYFIASIDLGVAILGLNLKYLDNRGFYRVGNADVIEYPWGYGNRLPSGTFTF